MEIEVDKEKTEKYIAFLQEAYEKNPIQNAWCLEEANQLKKQLEE